MRLKFCGVGILIAGTGLWANAQNACAPHTLLNKLSAELEDVLTKNPRAELEALAAKDKDIKAVGYEVQPSDRNCSSVTYKFPQERLLKPDEALYLAVPQDLRDRSVETLLLNHRQDPNYGDNGRIMKEQDKTGKRVWDTSPGLTSFQIHMKGAPDDKAWRNYQAPWGESGKWGAKFAEIGYSPEKETMEGVRSHGHKGIRLGDVSKDPLLPDAMRVVSVGKDPVLVSMVTMKLAPQKSDIVVEKIFTPGTRFGDHEKALDPEYGGGEHHGGKYPGAVNLGSYGSHASDLPEGWKLKDGELHIPLDAGYSLNAIEVAVGDMHDDGKPNSDGSIGTPGWSSLSISLQKASGGREVLMDRENVGKNDIMTGFPKTCDYVAKSGDELVIHSSSDIAHLMGVRMHLHKADAKGAD